MRTGVQLRSTVAGMTLFSLVVSCGGSAPAQQGRGETGSAEPVESRLIIRPQPTARWQADLRDVEKVLYSAAGQLWPYFPQQSLRPILVEPKGGPIVLNRRGPEGEYRVRLNTGGTYWSQYAFQFAHEFCHILCHYDRDEHRNGWFEESLCETASLFALRRMAETWKTNPPYPHWTDYARHLRAYADRRMEEAGLPADTTLAQWYRQRAEQLYASRRLRHENRVVAGALLPTFEKHPEHWEAVTYLNAGRSHESQTFREYLEDWRRHCPEKHRRFVGSVAQQFGIALAESGG